MKQKKGITLGITRKDYYTHDNSAAFVHNGKILFAASEERYSRKKHDGSFPKLTILAGLKFTKKRLSSIETVAIGFPKMDLISIFKNKYFYEVFLLAYFILINRRLSLFNDLTSLITVFYKRINESKPQKLLENKKIIYIDHHESHSASAYYTSGFNKAISIVIDAFGSKVSGEIRSGVVYLCDGENMKEVMSIPLFASLGVFYQSVTYSLGFTPGDGEGKTMGLAAYGGCKRTYSFLRPFAPSFASGTWVPGKDWLAGLLPCMPQVSYLFKSTRFGKALDNMIAENKKEDVAAAGQQILEEGLVELMKYLLKRYPEYHNVCLSGGLFLNVKANKKISEIIGVDNVYIHPNAGDGGAALGAALIADNPFSPKPLISCGLGESFTNNQIAKCLNQYKGKVFYKKKKNIAEYAASQLIDGKVIGWFQGRAEWGPRALGFRSVLADPRKIEIKERINHVLKNREWFMPFAPSVLEEHAGFFFKNCKTSPFMTMVFNVVKGKEKLIPAAIHIDNTARPNTVSKSNNKLYYDLLTAFYKKTGLPVILNTSFNKHGLPIVNSPKNAIDHLIMGAVDELIMGDYSVTLDSR